MNPFFPIFVDISKIKSVIVGGGRIAERRIETLLKFAPQLIVIAPQVTRRIEELAEFGQLRWIQRVFEETDFEDTEIGMVIAATNDRSVNQKVGELARKGGIPVSVADCKEESTFYFPGIAQKDNVVIGVTASGLDHKEAAKITKEAKQMLENLVREDQSGIGSAPCCEYDK